MIKLEFIYVLMGLLTGGVALLNALDKSKATRFYDATFWGLYSLSFLAGSYLPNFANGCLVLVMVLSVALKTLKANRPNAFPPPAVTPSAVTASAATSSEVTPPAVTNSLFIPALLIPAVTLIGVLFLKKIEIGGRLLLDPAQVTQISLGIATLVALSVGMAMLRPPLLTPIVEARKLMDSVGWAAVLPQMLASLGAVFALAGVGDVVADIAQKWIPLDNAFIAVATYAFGMALFTMVMGNAFAAFPVMTAGIGLPVIVGQFGGDVVAMSAIGMLSGFCGTLMTPMAANFNIVPAALLELPDQHAVIKAQIPTAIPVLIFNTLLMYLVVFR